MSLQATEATHKPPTLRRLCAAIAALSTALAPGSAIGLGLGDLQVRSFIGEPLDASVVVFATEDEELSTECFVLSAPSSGGVPVVAGARLALEQTARRSALRIRTDQAMTEPVMRFRLTTTCSNAGGLARDYVLLLDPRPAGAPESRVSLPPPPDPRAPSRAVASVAPSPMPAAGAGAAPPPPPAKPQVTPPPAAKRAPPPDAPKPKAAPEPKGEAKPAAGAAAPGTAAAPAKAAAPATPRDGPEAPFRLRLSGPEIDTSRGAVDERRRAEIRERRLLLEQDDQTAVILRLRESLRQLEGQLASIQQQVATAPAAAPSAASAPVAAPPSAAPAVAPAKSGEEPPFAPKPAPTQPKAIRPPPTESQSAVDWPWIIAGVLFALIAAGLSLWKRRKEKEPASVLDSPITYAPQAPIRPGPAPGSPAPAPTKAAPKSPAPKREPHIAESGAAPEPASTASAAPEEQVDRGALRRRYRQARFPELTEGTVSLGDTGSIIRGARTLYEDGDAARAIEFLELAITDNARPVELWLALFEVLRQEGLAAEFGNLAARFQREHGGATQWSKVQSIGREFDPDNPLFANGRGEAFDPLTDNWLGIPADFSADGIAAELHSAGLTVARGRRVG